MKLTYEGPLKITNRDVVRAGKNRAPDARHVIRDSAHPGLLLITNAASQVWVREYKPRGVDPQTGKRFSTRTIAIGSPATLSPDQARAEAGRIRDAVSDGRDPAAERKVAIDEAALQRSATVERAVADYVATLSTKERKGGGRISTGWANEQANHLRRAVAALGIASLPVESVDVTTVRRLQQGKAYRHRFGALNRFLDWAVHEDRIAANPCASIGRAYRPGAGGKRERTPSLRDLASVWNAAETALEPVFRDFARFAISTPARRNEVARLDWRHLDLEARVWRQPGRLTKNREPHELRLNPLALAILTRRWEEAGRPKVGLVFPSPRSGKPITAFSGVLRALHRATPAVERWALHDLRRSFASTLGRLGEDSDATIDAVLNHRQSATRGGVLGTYNRASRRGAEFAALERWGALVADALEGKFPEEPQVIPIRGRAKV
jgi:integrase